MANYYFPSQTEYYHLATGDYRITIKQKAPEPPDVPANYDIDLMLLEMGKLVYEFEIDPASQKERYARLHLTFHNKDNFFENPTFIADLEANYLFVSIIKLNQDSTETLVFYGFLERTNVERSDYKVNSNNELIYQKIKFTVLDALYYYKSNGNYLYDIVTIKSNGMVEVPQAVNDLLAYIDYPNTVEISTNIIIDTCQKQIQIADIQLQMIAEYFTHFQTYTEKLTAHVFIARLISGIGLRFYNYNGKYILEPKEFVDIDTTIDQVDILTIKKARRSKLYKGVIVKGMKNWAQSNKYAVKDSKYDLTHIFTHGDTLENRSSIVIDLDKEKDLQFFTWEHGIAKWNSGSYPTTNLITPDNWDEDNRIITGDVLYLCPDENAFAGMSIEVEFTEGSKFFPIEKVTFNELGANESLITVCTDNTIDGQDSESLGFHYDGQDYRIIFNYQLPPPANNDHFIMAIMILLERLTKIYTQIYINKEDDYTIKLYNIEKYNNLSANIIIPNILTGSQIRKSVIDFNKNTIQFLLL